MQQRRLLFATDWRLKLCRQSWTPATRPAYHRSLLPPGLGLAELVHGLAALLQHELVYVVRPVTVEGLCGFEPDGANKRSALTTDD